MEAARHDAVTGLPNRALFLERLVAALAGGHAQLAVLFIDLDRFKAVNDTLGHAAGDELLRAVGERIVGCLRGRDGAARFGGDEFAVLLDGADAAAAEAVADRIIAALRRAFAVGDGTAFIGATVGIAYPGAGDDAEALLRNADLAMYRGKHAGGGRRATFEPAMHAEVVVLERAGLEADLAAALREDRFVLHYEPVVDLGSGRTVAVEALLRWRHPRRGLLAPDAFLAIAEETGMSVPIGRWMLRRACAQVAGWRAQAPELGLSVGVSAGQLRDERFPHAVGAALEDTGLPGSALTLAVAERSLTGRDDDAARGLEPLKRLGAAIAIDDFGTGYASLRHLRRLPVDALRLDRSFVDALPGTPRDRALARMIVDLGRTLGLVMVAPGIETDGQLRALGALGCARGQGARIAPAMAPERIAAQLGAALLSSPGR
jgi:diguanylate cyclase (GGDEF)-like protein